MAESKYHVGQVVLLKNWRYRRDVATPVKVSKIGRKYATVERHGRELKFSLETGHAPGESGDFIVTKAEDAERMAHVEAIERLRELGFRGAHDFPRGLTTAALNHIADIAAADLNVTEN